MPQTFAAISGQLEELIRACRPYQLAFSIELAATEVEDCRLAPTGRYQHNPQYIERLLRENGYTNINQYPLILRQECGQNVKGGNIYGGIRSKTMTAELIDIYDEK